MKPKKKTEWVSVRIWKKTAERLRKRAFNERKSKAQIIDDGV